ncbi:MAG: hypothetical protein LBQ52_03840 [Helicobacteraceae bacterium]|jgi:hypothetical protein|nr:hypothetical protein [Helicobacteraceae bacterium]
MSIFNSPNLKALLLNTTLVKEIDSESESERVWIEIRLSPYAPQPRYPFRAEPYAALFLSKYWIACPIEKASFRLRYATLQKEDIENQYEPDERKVGKYIDIPSVIELEKFLNENKLNIDEFVDSLDTQYPL